MNIIKTLFITSLFVLMGCSKDESIKHVSELNIPTITGIEIRGADGTPISTQGTPNINTYSYCDETMTNYDNGSNNSISQPYCFNITSYPNPCREYFYVKINTIKENTLKKIWVVKAQYNANISESYSHIGNSTLLTVGGTRLLKTETTESNIMFNISSLQNGYYRLYVQMENITLYDNILIQNN